MLSTTLMESLLVQAIAAEQMLQVHMDHCYGEQASLSVKASKVN